MHARKRTTDYNNMFSSQIKDFPVRKQKSSCQNPTVIDCSITVMGYNWIPAMVQFWSCLLHFPEVAMELANYAFVV